MNAPAVPTPRLIDVDAAKVDPDGLPADQFAREKAELQARMNLIVDALQRPPPLASADEVERSTEAMRKVHRAGGVPLSDAEAIEFVTRRINLGRPQRSPKPAHGPPSRDTQYDRAYARRKGLFHKLVRLPSLRVGEGKIDLDRLVKLASKLMAAGAREREVVALILGAGPGGVGLKGKTGEVVTEREVRKARALLRKLGKWPKELPG